MRNLAKATSESAKVHSLWHFCSGTILEPGRYPEWTHEHEDKHIAMKKPKVVSLAEENSLIRVGHGSLMDRVVSILEQARTNVARSVNSNMVIAYWLVGREIVVALQGGEERAEYGERLLGDLSEQLTKRYGRGFSVTNLRYFRLFYQVFSDRAPEIHHSSSDELGPLTQDTVLNDLTTALETTNQRKGFSPNLSWTHYRVLSKIEQRPERLFYEIETEKAGWSVSLLERQIHSFLFARLLKSRDKAGVIALAEQGQTVNQPIDVIKQPYVLDFLNLPDQTQLHESDLESAIIENLQPFLLELGKGFAFVGRQYRVSTESQHFFIDLVFYNFLLKCFVLIDLKIGRLEHQDVGQMDMYLRMFDDLRRGEDDNPTVGLILCAEKDEIIARYSILHGSQQMFASKYMLYLPTEEELRNELARERDQIQARRNNQSS
jgi:predicted nuclease of restriction endonuclease-like (RecB) superfamily